MLIEKDFSYMLWRMVLFSDGHGFILSKNPRSHNFYITLQFVQEDRKLRCYRGGYHGDPQEAKEGWELVSSLTHPYLGSSQYSLVGLAHRVTLIFKRLNQSGEAAQA